LQAWLMMANWSTGSTDIDFEIRAFSSDIAVI
jgi:hypothetical protein